MGDFTLKGGRVVVGFAAETGDPLPEARRKLAEKGLDLIVANAENAAGGFGLTRKANTTKPRSPSPGTLAERLRRQIDN